MLLKEFYKILHTETVDPNNRKVRLRLNTEHSIYQGHFPEAPVLPGVCTLQMIKECVSTIKESNLQYKQISSCKFLSAINPIINNELQLSLTIKEEEKNELRLLAEGTANGTPFIKLKATLLRKLA